LKTHYPGATGDFTAVQGTIATINNLDSATEPVGVLFPAQQFLSFDAAPSFPTLNINFIFPGLYFSCSGDVRCTRANADCC
jgi:hypothetical protein